MPFSLFKLAFKALLALCALVIADAAFAQNKLFLRSPNGAGMISEPYKTFTPADGTFAVTGNVAGDRLTIQAANYSLELQVPAGQTIAPGTYDVTEKSSAQLTSRNAMLFYPNSYTGYCSTVSGRFQILELSRDMQGAVTSLAVNFEQVCNNYVSTLFGQLRFNGSLPTHVDSRIPGTLSFTPVLNAVPGATTTSNTVTVSELDGPIPLTISQGEYSINGATYASAPGTVKNGDTVRVRVIAPPNANNVIAAVLDFNGYRTRYAVGTVTGTSPQPTASGVIVLQAQPKYGSSTYKTTVLSAMTMQDIRLSKSSSYSPDERGIRVETNQYANGPNPTYYVELYGPSGTTVTPGNYLKAGSNPVSGLSSFLQSNGYTSLQSDFAKCDYGNPIELADVTVSEIEYASDGMPTKLAMDFVASCSAASTSFSRVVGHIRVNSTLPIDYTARLPIPFEFPGFIGATVNTNYVSSTGSATGINVPIPVTITGGEYSIGNGEFTSAPGVISNGQTIRVRLMSAATPNTLRVAMLTMGGIEFPYKVGTATGLTPQPTTEPILVQVTVPRSMWELPQTRVYSPATLESFVLAKRSYSQAFTVGVAPFQTYYFRWFADFLGINGAQLTAGNYPEVSSYNMGMYPAVSFNNYGNNYCPPSTPSSMRMNVMELDYTAEGVPSRLAIDYVINCPAGNSIVTEYGYLRINSTVPIDYTISTPAPFPFTAQIGLAPGTMVLSNEVTMRAINIPVPISIVNGEYSIDGGAYTGQPGTIAPGQTLRIRVQAPAQSDTAREVLVTAGGHMETFVIATAPEANPQPHGAPLAVFYAQDYTTGLTTQHVFSPATRALPSLLAASSNPDLRTHVRVNPIPSVSYPPPWQLLLAGPNQSLLQVGSYVCNGSYSSATGASCYTTTGYGTNSLSVATPICYNSSGSNTARPSNFVVHEIEHSVTGDTLRLAVDFIDNCAPVNAVPPYGKAAVFAFIRINSDYPIDHTIRQPIPFFFAPVPGAVPSTLVQSEQLSIKGFNVAIPISIAGGEYSIDGGGYTAAAGTINPGQGVRVRVTAGALANSVATANLTIGGVTGTFRVGTSPGFPPVANGNPLIYLISQGGEILGAGKSYLFSPATSYNVTAVRSFSQTVGVTATLPPASIYESWNFGFGAPNAALLVPGTYTNTAQYTSTTAPFMRVVSPSYNNCGQTPASQFTVHEIEYGDFNVDAPMTRVAIDFVQYCPNNPDPLYGYIRFNSNYPINPIADTIPATFAFATVFGIPRGTQATSLPVVIDGFNQPLPISVSNGEYSLDGGTFTSSPGIINGGQSVRMRAMASASFGLQTISTLTVGSRTATFTVIAEYANSYPNQITFPDVSNAPRNAAVMSAMVAISGTNMPATIDSIQGGEVSVAGRPFTSLPTTILPGETLQMRVVTGAQYNALHSMVAIVGGRYTFFSAQTLSQGVLQVTISGNGSVNIAPAGINCASMCSGLYDTGTALTLTASPVAGFGFTGWTGAGCSGTGPCAISMGLTAQVTATFAPLPPGAPVITQAMPGNGRATLVFTPAAGPVATGYAATCQPGNVAGSGARSPIVVTGLVNDVVHSCTVTASNAVGTSTSDPFPVMPSAGLPDALLMVVSRKTHGTAGDFDQPLDFMLPYHETISIEPRAASGGHKIVFIFNNPVTSASVSVVDGPGAAIPGATVTPGFADNELSVNIAGLEDNVRMFVVAMQVNGGTLNVVTPVGFLMGDVNGSNRVSAADFAAIKARTGANIAIGNNFLYDLNLSGQINAGDVSQAKGSAGRSLRP